MIDFRIFAINLSMQIGDIKAKNNDYLVARYQTSAEIAGAIVKAIQESAPMGKALAPYFKNTDPMQSAKLIFIFCKNAIPYKKESGARQTAKELPRILQDAKTVGGDCKHYAITTATLCKALNIPVKLRLISQRQGTKQPNHIYAVAIINNKEVVIDAVLKNFDTEARYNYKYDIKL